MRTDTEIPSMESRYLKKKKPKEEDTKKKLAKYMQ